MHTDLLRQSGLGDLLQHYGLPARSVRALLALGPDTDLRTVTVAGVAAQRLPGMLADLLVDAQHVPTQPFRNGLPLGPLEGVHVYAHNLHGLYAGKVHSPRCRHVERLTTRDDLLTLAEVLAIEAADDEDRRGSWNGSRLCAQCGGYAIRRLSDLQFEYLTEALELQRIREVEHWHARGGVGIGPRPGTSGMAELIIRADELAGRCDPLASAAALTRDALRVLMRRANLSLVPPSAG